MQETAMTSTHTGCKFASIFTKSARASVGIAAFLSWPLLSGVTNLFLKTCVFSEMFKYLILLHNRFLKEKNRLIWVYESAATR
jgi:hypothetical protein